MFLLLPVLLLNRVIIQLMLGNKVVVVGALLVTADIAVLLYFQCCCFAGASTFPIDAALGTAATVFGADASFR
jgi:hypothetical protein